MNPRTRFLERGLRELGEAAQDAHKSIAPPSHLVLRTATIAEVYTDSVLEHLVSNAPVVGNDLGRALVAFVGDSMYRTWKDRLRWLNDGFGIHLSGRKSGQELLTLVDLRNALVHGGQQLTRFQIAPGPKRILKLQAELSKGLGVQVEGHQLYLPLDIGFTAVRITRSFVLEMEEQVANYSLVS